MNKSYLAYTVILCIVLTLLCTGLISAQQIFKQNTPTDLKVQCIINGTFCSGLATCNVSVQFPDGSLLINNKKMTNQGSFHNITLPSTDVLGSYTCSATCCDTGYCGTGTDCNYEITPTGNSNNLGFYFLILILSAGIIIFGFVIKDAWITILGTFGLYFLGIYTILNGINGVKDMVTTWALGIIVLGIAGYISINSALEVIQEQNISWG